MWTEFPRSVMHRGRLLDTSMLHENPKFIFTHTGISFNLKRRQKSLYVMPCRLTAV